MSQNLKDKMVFLFSGLLIGMGVAAFFVNLKTIRASSVPFGIDDSGKQNLSESNSPSPFRSMFEDSFFESDPFADLDEIQSRLWRQWGDESPLSSSMRDFGGARSKNFEVQQTENSRYLIYEISMSDFTEGSSMDVSVDQQMVTVRGQKVVNSERRNSSHYGSSFYSSSSFSQSFSVPPGLDTENVIMDNQGQKVILKFPKLNSEV